MGSLTNRCVRFLAKQDARFIEEPFDAAPPAPDEIIGKSVVSLISTGSERGGYMDYNDNMAYPQITGYAAIMRAVEVGAGVARIRKGDLFYAGAPHHLYNRVKEDDAILVPQGLEPEQAVFCRFPAVSMSSIVQMTVKPTEPVLVTGLGIVGLMCSQALQLFGYEVWAVDPEEKRRENARQCGIANAVAGMDDVAPLKGKFGAALECSGFEEAIYAAADQLRRGGDLYLVGVPWRKTTSMDGHSLLLQIFYGYLNVRSGWEWSLPRKSGDFQPNSHTRNIELALRWIAEGKLRMSGATAVEDPAECDRVYREIGSGELQRRASAVLFDWRAY